MIIDMIFSSNADSDHLSRIRGQRKSARQERVPAFALCGQVSIVLRFAKKVSFNEINKLPVKRSSKLDQGFEIDYDECPTQNSSL